MLKCKVCKDPVDIIDCVVVSVPCSMSLSDDSFSGKVEIESFLDMSIFFHYTCYKRVAGKEYEPAYGT